MANKKGTTNHSIDHNSCKKHKKLQKYKNEISLRLQLLVQKKQNRVKTEKPKRYKKV